MKTTPVTLRFEEKQHTQAALIAEVLGINFSEFIRQAVAEKIRLHLNNANMPRLLAELKERKEREAEMVIQEIMDLLG